MKVSIVIPNWNGEEKLKKNLPEVLKVKGVEEIIVVDDASTDGSVSLLKEKFINKIRIIEKNNNTGFGSTVNEGVEHTKGDIIFLLNNDALPDANCLDTAISHFNNEKVFSVSFNTGGNWSWARWENGFFWHYQVNGKVETHETLWASGGSGIFRKNIWNELDGFDTIYDPFYVEDLDLGYRAVKRGYINIWEKGARVEHYKQVGVIAQHFSKEYINSISERNQLFFIWNNITDADLIWQHIWSLVKRLIKNPKYLIILFSAIVAIPKVLKKRRINRNEARFTDKSILDRFTNR